MDIPRQHYFTNTSQGVTIPPLRQLSAAEQLSERPSLPPIRQLFPELDATRPLPPYSGPHKISDTLSSGQPSTPSEDSDVDVNPADGTSIWKRRRPILSCAECKRRKIKCDRVQPCAPCISRGWAATCQFYMLDPARQQHLALNANHNIHTQLDELEAKLLHLVPGYTTFSDYSHHNPDVTSPTASTFDPEHVHKTESSPFALAISPQDVSRMAIGNASQLPPSGRRSFSGSSESQYNPDNLFSVVRPNTASRRNRRVSVDGSVTARSRPSSSRRGSTQRIPRDAPPRRASEADVDPRIRHMENMYASYLRGDVHGSRPGSSRA